MRERNMRRRVGQARLGERRSTAVQDTETRRHGDAETMLRPPPGCVPSPCSFLSLSPCLLFSLSPCLRVLVPRIVHGLLCALFLVATGCASFELPGMHLEKYIPTLTGRTGQFRRPLRMVAFWTDTVRTGEAQPAMRGFGGRLMFFDREHGKSVKVAGTLVIYAFDESHGGGENPRPDRKYVFPPDQFAKHYSKSELGHSYSVWIPWDKAGGEAKEIGLICRFTPVEGGAVLSEQVRQALPGTPAEAKDATAKVNVVRFDAPVTDPAGRRMLTTTIDLNGPPDRRLPTALARARTWQTAAGETATSTNVTTSSEAAAPGPSQANGAPAANAAQNQTANASQATGATERGSAPAASGSWLARFGQHQSRAPGELIVPPDRARGPWRPSHVVPPYVPPTTPSPSVAPVPVNIVGAAQQ
jgi:hypothetical protein